MSEWETFKEFFSLLMATWPLWVGALAVFIGFLGGTYIVWQTFARVIRWIIG